MFWDGSESSGSRSYVGIPFPWVIETNGIAWIGYNLVNLGLNLTFFALIAEISVFRFKRIQLIWKRSRN